MKYIPCLICVFALAGGHLFAQTSPPEGIRQNTPTVHAFVNAKIVQAPGRAIENGTLVIRDGVIVSAGAVSAPADARIWDMNGKTLYPGLIDAYSDYGMPKTQPESDGQQPSKPPDQRGPVHWNSTVMADQDASQLFLPDPKTAEKLRGQGITSVLTSPAHGIFKGTSAVVNLGEGKASDQILRANVAHHIKFERDPGHDGYPSSLMGTIALIRQTLLDADWYQKAHDAYTKDPSLPHPETNKALAALRDVRNGITPVVIEATDEQSILRADNIAREFSLRLIVRGSGYEYKRLESVAGTKRSIILPLNFPDPPAVHTSEEALQYSLADLRHWDEAPENPARLNRAGVQVALTSSLLKDAGKFLDAVRTSVKRGLDRDAALAALTTTPARLFGVEKQLGSLESGKQANFIITSGDLFDDRTVIHETWVNGNRYEVKPVPDVDTRGKWRVTVSGRPEADSLILTIKGKPEALEGTIRTLKDVKLTSVAFSALRLTLTFPGDTIGFSGMVRMSAVMSAGTLNGNGEWPDGRSFVWTGTRLAPFTPEPDTAKPKPVQMASFSPSYPYGAFGRAKVPDQPAIVIIKNTTIWTSGPQGVLRDADMIAGRGKIIGVGRNLQTPQGALVIDGTGKHVTAGLIDAHSHMAATGGLNEAGQAISAETRVGDVIDCNSINVYRALAGGLTAAHVLHGSANPIGGQSQLIKLRWGMLPEEMKFEGAPPTIKFALGENVKQSNWGERYTTRYPQTRMGVEQIMRDEFQAALDYEKAWQRYEQTKSGIPPRRDLELDAILEILKGKRFIHCHSYRQDEILAMMRVAEDFGIRVQTFQHILEGYKVADVMAKHGAGGSSFTDWWAYKLEVYDAIPYNGVLMHDQGVLVTFNSDSDELARRMNLEAAKAVKYGSVPEEEALKFVTINAAKQLKVEHRVGSLEVGKDADFVIWSGHPLSTYTLCEQTWVDGRKLFDREEDRTMNETVTAQRAALIQKAIAAKKTGGEAPLSSTQEDGHIDQPHSMFEEGQ